jgi:hypothetical protein
LAAISSVARNGKNLRDRGAAAALAAGLDLLPAVLAPPGGAHPEESMGLAGHRAEHGRIVAVVSAVGREEPPPGAQGVRTWTTFSFSLLVFVVGAAQGLDPVGFAAIHRVTPMVDPSGATARRALGSGTRRLRRAPTVIE